MHEIGVIGYLTAAVGFAVLSLLLLSSWRGRTQGVLLVVASVLTSLWAGLAAYQTSQHVILDLPFVIVELLRDCTWIGFLVFILKQKEIAPRLQRNFEIFLSVIAVIIAVNIVIGAFSQTSTRILYFRDSFELTVVSLLLVTICGVVFIEQLLRNTTHGERWSLKYLCIGVGGIFAYDIYLYSDALLFNKVDEVVWLARGYVNTMVVPLIAVAAARNPQWSLDVFVSRRVVFHSATVIITGAYLLIIAAGGYYIRRFGGTWGGVAQLCFLFAAIVLLALFFLSGQIRGKVRIFVNKHFFSYRYDYRDEWLKFIDTLSGEKLDTHLRIRVISAIADEVDSPGGLLWLKDNGTFRLSANWNLKLDNDSSIYDNSIDSLVNFLNAEKQVVDIDDDFTDGKVGQLRLPSWINSICDAWLFVPLLQRDDLYGFILLTRPRAEMKINWENRDLLITTGRQATNHLALLDASERLMEARQFEAFNRLSAYVVHDLKNVVAQLSLLLRNAEKHRDNPEFVGDAFKTVENAVSKMNKMLSQLRKKDVNGDAHERIELNRLVKKAIEHRSTDNLVPKYEEKNGRLYVLADADRLTSVMEHLIQNAQEATELDGFVRVELLQEDDNAVIRIIDSGIGMDSEFIQNRLFKPFDTTKGNAGMGIGVYESREIVRSFGGTMRVNSTVGRGTAITITLPVNQTDEMTTIL